MKNEKRKANFRFQIAKLQDLDNQQRDLQQQLNGHAEKLVGGKLQKQDYIILEETIRNKWRDINTRITSILNQY